MGRFFPVFGVFVALINGYHIFKEPAEGLTWSVMPRTIFLFATFLLLCEIKLYPACLREMGWIGQAIIEYFLAYYVMENLLMDFWIPVEQSSAKLSDTSSALFKRYLNESNLKFGSVRAVLDNETIHVVLNYILSLFFLLAVLQATKAIDFGILRCGIGFFFKDIGRRLYTYFQKEVSSVLSVRDDRKKIRSTLDYCLSQCPEDCDFRIEEYYPYNGDIFDLDSNNNFAFQKNYSDFEMTMNEELFE